MKKAAKKAQLFQRKNKWVFFGVLSEKDMKALQAVPNLEPSKFASSEEVFLPRSIQYIACVDSTIYFVSDENPRAISRQVLPIDKNSIKNDMATFMAEESYRRNIYLSNKIPLRGDVCAMCASRKFLYVLIRIGEETCKFAILRWPVVDNSGFSKGAFESAEIECPEYIERTLSLFAYERLGEEYLAIYGVHNEPVYVVKFVKNSVINLIAKLEFPRAQITLPYDIDIRAIYFWVADPASGELTHYEVPFANWEPQKTAHHYFSIIRESTALAYHKFNLEVFGSEGLNPLLFIATKSPNALYAFSCSAIASQPFPLVANVSNAYFKNELEPVDSLKVIASQMLLAANQHDGLIYVLKFPIALKGLPKDRGKSAYDTKDS